MFKIVIAQQKRPEIGDKFCSAMAQKGTVGMILEEVDMPFMEDGSIPDMIINPHCLPSRMTINQIMASIREKLVVQKMKHLEMLLLFKNHLLKNHKIKFMHYVKN